MRRALSTRGYAVGIFGILDGPLSASLMSRLGYDFVVFDLQHGPLDLQRIDAILAAVSGTECTPLARVQPGRPDQIEWVLDMGAHGVIVPLVNSAADAVSAVNACRYPPAGRRSVGAIRNYLHRSSEYGAFANDDVVCVIQIEHVDGVENIEAILAVPGVDAVMIGHVDLALSMGYPMSYGSTISNTVPVAVADAITSVEASCAEARIPVIPVVGTLAEFDRAVSSGHRVVCSNTDYHLLKAAAEEQLQACRARLQR